MSSEQARCEYCGIRIDSTDQEDWGDVICDECVTVNNPITNSISNYNDALAVTAQGILYGLGIR